MGMTTFAVAFHRNGPEWSLWCCAPPAHLPKRTQRIILPIFQAHWL